ncbi:MAG: hypothetical protein JST91_18260 [Actinobacteria bacterium]|nr:hypothetical protein [Actinomycetota bacterium]
MGREAVVHARVGDEAGEVAGEVKALLEARELILRGDIRRRYPIAAMTDVLADAASLRFRCAGETAELELGERAAAAWATAILTPPPTLRAKLGLDRGATALLIGPCDDAELAQALDGVVTDEREDAAMVIARVDGPDRLDESRTIAGSLPLWVVYPKGRGVGFGDAAIREILRAQGWRDSKSCSVSERLTATRYIRR